MMKFIKKPVAILMMLCCLFNLTACESFYKLFTDENDTSSGVWFVIYDKSSTDEEIENIPDVPLMKSSLGSEIKTYDLSYEITINFDLETNNEASLSVYYYHNRDNQDANDYCKIGNSYMGTYVMTDNKITFKFEKDGGYNMAFYDVGSDYANLEAFKKFSYADDGSCGIWAYSNATWEYENDAVILEDVVKNLPDAVEFTVSGNRIVTWKAADVENTGDGTAADN